MSTAAQAISTYGIKPTLVANPDLELSRSLVRASLDFNEIYSQCDLDGELMEAVDAVIRVGDAELMGKVFHALTSTYVEIIAHRRADIQYTGPSELDAVRAVLEVQ